MERVLAFEAIVIGVESQMAEPPTLSNDKIAKKRAFGRLAIALVLIAAAILGLTLINRVSVEEPPAPAVATAPPTPETPENTAQSTAPPPPEVSRVPDPGETPPPEPSFAPAPESIAVPPSPAPSQGQSTPAPVQSAQPMADLALAPQPAKPSSPILKLEDAPIAPGKGYSVQMGVFNSYANADALLEKLKERGVPAYTETRVLVGPFRTRQEAKKAAVTLKGLGEPAIITPPKRFGSR